MALPPLLAGAEKVTVAWALPAAAVTAGGAPGAVITGANVAVTCFALSIVAIQVPVPLHAPLQPVKVEPASGVAVSVTLPIAAFKFATHVAPQAMPVGLEATMPEPLPALVTTRAKAPKSCPPRTKRTYLLLILGLTENSPLENKTRQAEAASGTYDEADQKEISPSVAGKRVLLMAELNAPYSTMLPSSVSLGKRQSLLPANVADCVTASSQV